MNTLADLLLRGGIILDALGIAGLGLFALAALRLARHHRSWGGHLMAAGAMALLLGRLLVLIAPLILTRELLAELGRTFISLQSMIPVFLLTAGLAGIVWGLWGHERWIREGH
jgi:hypothetical protein